MKKYYKVIAFTLITFLIGVIFLQRQYSVKRVNELPVGTLTVIFTVTDKQTNEPIKGSSVTVTLLTLGPGNTEVTGNTISPSRTLLTNSKGIAVFSNLAASPYVASVTMDGFHSWSDALIISKGQNKNVNVGLVKVGYIDIKR